MTVALVKQVLGGVPPIGVRDRYSALLRGETKEIFLRWDEIKDLILLEDMCFWDGAEGVNIRIE